MTTTTHVEALDRAMHSANVWLKEIKGELGTDDAHRAYQALRTTLHALRDRLPPEEATHLGAQLPLLVRGVYYDGWKLAGKPVTIRKKEEFLEWVRSEVADPAFDPEAAARAVFRVLDRRVTAGEVADVRHALPQAIRELWPK